MRPTILNLHRPRPGAAWAVVLGTVMLVALLLTAANWFVTATGCSVHKAATCRDYNERYELINKHPELLGQHKDASGNWVPSYDAPPTR